MGLAPRWLVFFGALALGGCGGGGDPAPDLGAPVAGEAYVLGSRIRMPSGRTFYATMLPSLEPTTVDLSESLEISGFARSFAFDGAVFTMDSESLTIVRWAVDDALALSEVDRLSMANLGFSSFNALFAFLAPDRAVYIDPQQRQVVLWNPRDMVVEGTVPFGAAALREQFEEVEILSIAVSGDRLLLPIAWTTEDRFIAEPTVGVLILDAFTGETLDVITDDRCAVAGGAFATDNGDVYVIGDSGGGAFEVFGDNDLPPPCVLRVRAGQSVFDPDYYVNLSDVAASPIAARLVGLPSGVAVTRVVAEDVDPDEFTDPFLLTLLDIWEWRLLDLVAGTAQTLPEVPRTAVTFPPVALPGGPIALIQESTDGTSTLFLVRENGTVARSVTVTGEILQLGRVR